jgi:putative acetyltransferase
MSDLNLKFRLANQEDFINIKNIYQQSVIKIAPSLYNKKQVKAWSDFTNNKEKFYDFIFRPTTYLLEKDTKIIAFCGLENNGHIASFYVHPDFNRQGYGTKILTYVLEIGQNLGIKRFFTEASFFSQPVFSIHGFDIIAIETVRYGSVSFDRFQMEKVIN